MALLAVFLGGLMVGTTPEFLKKRLHARHMKLVSLYILVLPVTDPGRAAQSRWRCQGSGRRCSTPGQHGLSEVLYAFTSSAANNGSAFGGFSGNTTWYNVALAFAMVAGRFIPIIAGHGVGGDVCRPAARRYHRRHAPHPSTDVHRVDCGRHADHGGP